MTASVSPVDSHCSGRELGSELGMAIEFNRKETSIDP